VGERRHRISTSLALTQLISYPGHVTKGRLTRQELSWLLTQEAQHAAERLRDGVKVLRTQAPPPSVPDAGVHDPAHHVDASLDALDDVMKMLSNLNLNRAAPAPGAAPRRGRIDVAALLVELAPESPVQIEPGSGTEVYGDEADLRRMLQILVGHGSGAGAPITVRRDGDEVRVCVTLGPDTSPTAETERAWLSRMALRYGGRHELEGGNEIVSFPAEGASERSEREALRKELDEVRKQSEVYARELAAVFDRWEEVTTTSTVPPPPGQASLERFATLTKICAGIASELKNAFGSAARDVASMRRHDVTDEQLDTLRRRFAHAQAILASIGSIGSLRADELHAEVDLAQCARAAVADAAAHAEREGVSVSLRVRPEGARAYVRRGPKAVGALARELVHHAIAASPRGGAVEITVQAEQSALRLVVDDAGPPLPASARRAFLSLETHAGAYGRPSGLPIFMAAELAGCQGAQLELSDAPQGGLRVAVTFPKT
jgi:hypothetical protein